MDDPNSSRVRRPAKPVARSKGEPALLSMPKQTGDAIRRRREIREAFHDSKARTIKPTRDQP